MIALLTTSGTWMFGFNNGVIGGCVVLPSFHRDFNLPPTTSTAYTSIISNIVSFVQIGALAGSFLVFPIVKNLGRRWALVFSGATFFAGSAMQVFSHGSVDLMYVGRAVSGVGLGSVTVIAPMYIAEVSPPAIRGALVGLCEINNQTSSLLAFWCNYLVNIGISGNVSRQWQIPLAMQLIPAGVICLAATFVLPESPRFLLEKGKTAQARKVLSFLRHLDENHEYINYEIEQVEDALRRQRQMMQGADRWQLLRELTWKGNRNRLIIGCLLMWGANVSGINAINFYTPTIFRSIGFDGTTLALLLSGFFALAKTLATFVSLFFFVDKAGRKNLLLISSLGVALSLWYIGAYITATDGGDGRRSAAGYVALTCIYIYAISFSTAWNGIPWVYCAEIFPSKLKEMCLSLTTANQWLAQFVVARISPYMLNAGHGSPFFFVFAAGTMISALLVYFFLPETKGRTLEAMDEIFGTPYKTSRDVPEVLDQDMVRVNTLV